MTSKAAPPATLALISMPWALFNRPSIQLGILKAYVEQQTNLHVELFHPYLGYAQQLGTNLYHQISLSGWAGEALFAPLLFPEVGRKSEQLFINSLSPKHRTGTDYPTLVAHLRNRSDRLLERLLAQNYLLVGFSVCFNQLLGSLYIARRLKEISPKTVIVFGGTSCCSDAGNSLLQTFPQLDFVVDGEGEQALVALCLYLTGKASSLPATVRCRPPMPAITPATFLSDLSSLPTPDYRSYHNEMRDIFPSAPFIPTLPVEFSRGCWWNKCTFCNLNLQWQNYRSKSHQQILAEVESLSRRHEALDFVFTDNALPPKEADSFFAATAHRNPGHRFFAEIRTLSSPQRLAGYRHGGLDTVQIGIEALSTSLLKKMGKGTTAINNIAAMKMGLANNITVEGNLIVEFPQTTPSEISATMAALDFVLPYPPLQVARFFLGYGSPIARHPKPHGIKAITVHPNSRLLFPPEILPTLTLLAQGYRGDRARQQRLWRPIRKKLAKWQAFHASRQHNASPPLSFRDGGTFLIIRQELPDGSCLHHRLRGLSRKIYLFCDIPRKLSEIGIHFKTLPLEKIEKFCTELQHKKLLFREDDRVLALAVKLDQPDKS